MSPAKLIFAATVLVPLLCAQNTGSIAGVITNSVTSGPVGGVKVQAVCFTVGSTRCQDASTVTDAAGAFRLPTLLEGRYLMSLEKEGFAPGPGILAASVSSKEARFDAKLTPLANLQGRVIDPEGKPVAAITVQYGLGRTAVTDEQGVFVIQKLSPSLMPLLAKVKAQPSGKEGERLVNTYYPSEIRADQAIAIKVEGTDVSGYEIRLRTAPARSVRGMLLDAKGQPMPYSSVMLVKAALPARIPIIYGVPTSGPSAGTEWDRVTAGADGVFEFPAVLEGDWILRSYGLGPGNRQGAAAEIHVGRSDIDNTTIRLTEAFPIEVSSEWSDSQALKLPYVQAWVLPIDGQLVASTGRDADTPFTQHNQGLPGRYIVGPASAAAGSYVSAVMLDGRNILWQPVELSGPTNMKLVFKKDGGTVRGSVAKGGGSTVLLMAEPTAYARFGLTARCDPDGNFSIPDVPPGNYTAVAFQNNRVLYQRDLLVRFDSTNGKRVKIEAGAIETVELSVN